MTMRSAEGESGRSNGFTRAVHYFLLLIANGRIQTYLSLKYYDRAIGPIFPSAHTPRVSSRLHLINDRIVLGSKTPNILSRDRETWSFPPIFKCVVRQLQLVRRADDNVSTLGGRRFSRPVNKSRKSVPDPCLCKCRRLLLTIMCLHHFTMHESDKVTFLCAHIYSRCTVDMNLHALKRAGWSWS